MYELLLLTDMDWNGLCIECVQSVLVLFHFN